MGGWRKGSTHAAKSKLQLGNTYVIWHSRHIAYLAVCMGRTLMCEIYIGVCVTLALQVPWVVVWLA